MTIATTATKAICAAAIHYIDQGWCQGEYAHDANGNPVNYLGRKATHRCLVAALEKAAYELNCEDYSAAAFVRVVFHTPMGLMPTDFNDHPDTTANQVISVLEKAANDNC